MSNGQKTGHISLTVSAKPIHYTRDRLTCCKVRATYPKAVRTRSATPVASNP